MVYRAKGGKEADAFYTRPFEGTRLGRFVSESQIGGVGKVGERPGRSFDPEKSERERRGSGLCSGGFRASKCGQWMGRSVGLLSYSHLDESGWASSGFSVSHPSSDSKTLNPLLHIAYLLSFLGFREVHSLPVVRWQVLDVVDM